jgi:hypothetical protein
MANIARGLKEARKEFSGNGVERIARTGVAVSVFGRKPPSLKAEERGDPEAFPTARQGALCCDR